MPFPHHFQDFNQTPSHQNQASVRAGQQPYATGSSPSSLTSVASCISKWEQRLPVEADSQARHLWTPQRRSRTPAPCHGRRGRRWADAEAPSTTLVYGLDLEAGARVSVVDVLSVDLLESDPLASCCYLIISFCRSSRMSSPGITWLEMILL